MASGKSLFFQEPVLSPVTWSWGGRWYSPFTWKGLRNSLLGNFGKYREGSIQGRLIGKCGMNQEINLSPIIGQGQCYVHPTFIKLIIIKTRGVPGWLSQLNVQPTSAQVRISRSVSLSPALEPHVKLCADSSELGACFEFCLTLSLCPSPAHSCSLPSVQSLSLSK